MQLGVVLDVPLGLDREPPQVGDDGVRLGRERLRKLALVRAGREEQGAEVRESGRSAFMSDIRSGCQTAAEDGA